MQILLDHINSREELGCGDSPRFVCKYRCINGVINAINDFRRPLVLFSAFPCSSTSATHQLEHPSVSFPNFLVETLWFSEQQSLSISTRLAISWRLRGGHNKVSDFKFAANANPVIHFFQQHDFQDVHIRNVVSFYPRILITKVDKTLKPKLKALQDLGFSGSDLVSFV